MPAAPAPVEEAPIKTEPRPEPSHPEKAPAKTPRPPPQRPEKAPVTSGPRPPGTLFVHTTPWSKVSVGGRQLGNTPLANVSLPAGSQAGFWPSPAPGPLTDRQWQVVGGEDLVEEGRWQ